MTRLVCSRCGRSYEPGATPLMCESMDMGRLDVEYDYELVKEVLNKSVAEARRHMGVWGWAELLPADPRFSVRLGEGSTPLLKAERLGEALGLKNLYLKDETRNPTGSFKDRSMTVSVSKAREIGVGTTVTASSGNAAAALAAYSAKAGLRTVAFVLHTAGSGKIAQLCMYGAKVVKVRGVERGEDPTVRMMVETHKRYGWYPSPSFGPFNPYQVEGPKTMVYELAVEMGWEKYDWLIAPTGSGCLAAGLWRGLRDLTELGLVGWTPGLVLVQPKGNSPLVRAILRGLSPEEVEPERNPRTIASGLSDPYPWDGDAAMEGVRRTGGAPVSVSDEEILDAVKELARYEGVFAEPSGAAGLAGAKRLLEDGVIDKSDKVVVLVTGSGLKDPEVALRLAPSPPEVQPSLSDLEKVLPQVLGSS